MNTDITPFALTLVLTMIPALLTGIVSILLLILNKEQKVSEFRQAWINGLREELATFFSTARALCRTMEEAQQRHDVVVDGVAFSDEKVGNMRLSTADSWYRIQLRLNKNEEEHKEVERLLLSAITIQNQLNRDRATDYTPALTAIDLAANCSRDVLKKEWERVKIGEPSFRTAKRVLWLVVLITVLATVLGATHFTKKGSNQPVDSAPVSTQR